METLEQIDSMILENEEKKKELDLESKTLKKIKIRLEKKE
jgi:hypothetical protein